MFAEDPLELVLLRVLLPVSLLPDALQSSGALPVGHIVLLHRPPTSCQDISPSSVTAAKEDRSSACEPCSALISDSHPAQAAVSIQPQAAPSLDCKGMGKAAGLLLNA